MRRYNFFIGYVIYNKFSLYSKSNWKNFKNKLGGFL